MSLSRMPGTTRANKWRKLFWSLECSCTVQIPCVWTKSEVQNLFTFHLYFIHTAWIFVLFCVFGNWDPFHDLILARQALVHWAISLAPSWRWFYHTFVVSVLFVVLFWGICYFFFFNKQVLCSWSLALNSESSCLSLLSSRITGMCQDT